MQSARVCALQYLKEEDHWRKLKTDSSNNQFEPTHVIVVPVDIDQRVSVRNAQDPRRLFVQDTPERLAERRVVPDCGVPVGH
eukprot:4513691-Pyramimonas_sp.AAC.1